MELSTKWNCSFTVHKRNTGTNEVQYQMTMLKNFPENCTYRETQQSQEWYLELFVEIKENFLSFVAFIKAPPDGKFSNVFDFIIFIPSILTYKYLLLGIYLRNII